MNAAFIDGQNLHWGTKEYGWAVDHKKLRFYLFRKYKITEAYYFMGYIKESEQDLYTKLREAGYILMFREHSEALRGNKKGNVDNDIIFEIMKRLVEKSPIKNIFIISGDGDYKRLVDFLIGREVFGKILFPNRKFASSLYQGLEGQYFDYLETDDIRMKIEYIPHK